MEPGACRYRESVAEHVSDAEFAMLHSFRLPGRVLLVRAVKIRRKQPCASLPRCRCSACGMPLLAFLKLVL